MALENSERDPLMEDGSSGVRNTTLQFLRSFSVLSDDSDFDELDEPDTPGDFLDAGGDGDVEASVRHTISTGVKFEAGTKPSDTGTACLFICVIVIFYLMLKM